jgi:phage terminase small subunit
MKETEKEATPIISALNLSQTSTKPAMKTSNSKRAPGKRGPDKKPRAKPKPRTNSTPKTPGSKVIVKKSDVFAEVVAGDEDNDENTPFEPYQGLNMRQSMFVNYYISSLNATRSAEKAGYSGNANALAVIGHKLLRNAKIAKLILEHYQRNVMGKDEMTIRLSKMARASFAPFLKIEDNHTGSKTVRLDLSSEEAQDNLDMIRECDNRMTDKIAINGDNGEESALLVSQVHIKLHDPLKAMDLLAKMYGNLPPYTPPAAQDNFTINGNPVIKKAASISFLSKVLGVAPEQIPVTVEPEPQT